MTLTATDAAVRRRPPPQLVTDILWTAATPADDLEHLHSFVTSDRVELTFFHGSANWMQAHAAAIRICERALRSSPTLHGWVLGE
ncbi:hypothetical protein ABZU32_28840 [Sphaerisporangium sp. NPDC005288]|uniref:hypothetical protein n=1 Tax=Sphaerisporangium sp. NPDC005288 TaxID=3155114 RepID=UPI0033AEBBFB